MMNLKKNDKIIIIVAIAIIIIAGIGIAAYRSPEKTDREIPKAEKSLFSVKWDISSGSLSTISEFSDKKSPFEDTISIDKENLKNITFNLSWTDDKAPLFGRFGLDTLTLEITTPDGATDDESDKSASKTREGNVAITVPVGNKPSSEPIEADNYDDAKKILEEEYYNDKWVNKEFTIKVGVEVGEIRILKKLADKGNYFNLEITYDYYDATLEEEETKETSEDPFGDFKEEGYTPPYLSMIIGTGCGRYI